MPYVELNRKFEEFREVDDQEETIASSLRAFTSGKGMSWSELLDHRFVVVLGEAGTGKTTEFKERARVLSNESRPPFFIPLEDLAEQQPLPLEDEGRFNIWKEGTSEGFFFLDSVDEARLANPPAFNRALRNFVRMVGSSGSRAIIVVSCRVSDWQFRTDLNSMQNALSSLVSVESVEVQEESSDQVPGHETVAHGTSASIQPHREIEPSEVEVKVVRMLPLDNLRIARLAGALGVEDSDDMVRALEVNDLGDFAGRPRDLEWLVQYWQENGSFGELTEMVELNIEQKLRERNPSYVQEDTSLSTDRARRGAEALAAATVLCGKQMIALPDPELERDLPTRSFWPQEVLPDWNDREIQALLTKGAFDPASLGRVRFHHPMVRDYLAACWMAGKVAKGMPISKVRGLVLRNAFGKSRPIPSKRQVLGWLVGMLPEIRSEVIRFAPDILLYCGDAKQVPVAERGQALRVLAGKLREIEHTDWIVYDTDVRRVVDSELAPVINVLLTTEVDNYEMANFLLRMVEIGRLGECATTALEIALNQSVDDGIRMRAARAIVSVGSPGQRRELAQAFQNAEWMSNYLLGHFCGALFPEIFSVEEILSLVKRGEPEREWSGIGLGASFEHMVVNNCPESEMGSLLAGLLELAREEPLLEVRNTGIISDRYAWVRRPIVSLIERILEEISENTLPLEELVEGYLLINRCRPVSDLFIPGLEEYKGQVGASPPLRKAIFWRMVRDQLQRGINDVVRTLIDINEILPLNNNDLDWLLEDISSLTDAGELGVAFEAALDIWRITGQPETAKGMIIEVLEPSSDNDELVQYVTEALNPPPRAETSWEREHRERQVERDRAEREALHQAREDLLARIEEIRTGEAIGALIFLYEKMGRHPGARGSAWARTNWQALTQDFGEDLAQAACEGFKASWRRYTPCLPHEKQVMHEVEYTVILGLTGLAIEIEEGANFPNLSPEEADRATRYALREMNGFPEWFEKLAENHPLEIGPLLSEQLRAELTAQRDDPPRGDILSSIKYAPPDVRALCIGDILVHLSQGDSPQIGILKNELDIVVNGSDEDRRRLSEIADHRTTELLSGGNDESLFHWLLAWLKVDGSSALDFIEGLIAERDEHSSPLVLGIAAEFGASVGRGQGLEGADFLKPNVLGRTIRMVYLHIRPEEDIRHTDAYTPGPRDDAQSFRSWMGGYLAQQKSEDAQHVLQALANDLEPASARTWMKRLAEQQAAGVTEYSAWAPSDVSEFGAHHEKGPASANDLFEIALDRIDDIKEDIERGEFSDRDLFRPRMHENLIQKWLAGRLERESRNRFSIAREEEVDQSKKTDIRLHNPTAGLVTVEIKPVESKGRYTFQELIEALEEQLVGQYMHSGRSRYGILVIGMLGERYWLTPDRSSRFYFSELLGRLNERAQEIVETDEQVEALQVIGIDFT